MNKANMLVKETRDLLARYGVSSEPLAIELAILILKHEKRSIKRGGRMALKTVSEVFGERRDG